MRGEPRGRGAQPAQSAPLAPNSVGRHDKGDVDAAALAICADPGRPPERQPFPEAESRNALECVAASRMPFPAPTGAGRMLGRHGGAGCEQQLTAGRLCRRPHGPTGIDRAIRSNLQRTSDH